MQAVRGVQLRGPAGGPAPTACRTFRPASNRGTKQHRIARVSSSTSSAFFRDQPLAVGSHCEHRAAGLTWRNPARDPGLSTGSPTPHFTGGGAKSEPTSVLEMTYFTGRIPGERAKP